MAAYKIATKIDGNREIRISEEGPDKSKPTQEAQELEKQLAPLTRGLLGIARGTDEEDYLRYLEDKHR